MRHLSSLSSATIAALSFSGAILLGVSSSYVGARITDAPSARAAASLAAPFSALAIGAGTLFAIAAAAGCDAIDSSARRPRRPH